MRWLTSGTVALCMTLCVASSPTIARTAGHTESGEASYYSMKYQSRPTASGETFKQSAATAAHRTLPFGTKVKVINTETGDAVVVKINDRGPFVKGRVIDLSRSAFEKIADTDDGTVPVKIKVVQ